MQHLEEEAFEEESRGQLNFLSACQGTLGTSPLESCGLLLASYQVLLGHTLMSHLFNIHQGVSPPNKGPPQGFFLFCTWALTQAQVTASLTISDGHPTSLGGYIQGNSWGAPSSQQHEIMPLHKVLMTSCQEAFGWDTHLVRKTREEYFRNHCPNFNSENIHDLMNVFWHMAKTTGLLGSAIHEIQEVWTRWEELQHTSHALRALPKCLKFFWVVSPSESPKVMGLVGIHHPNAL